MPVGNSFGAGQGSYSNSTSTILIEKSLTDDALVYIDFPLQNQGLSTVVFYVNQITGAVASTVVFEMTVTASGADPQWRQITPPGTVPSNVPQLVTLVVPSRGVRIGIQRPSGQATTVQLGILATS